MVLDLVEMTALQMLTSSRILKYQFNLTYTLDWAIAEIRHEFSITPAALPNPTLPQRSYLSLKLWSMIFLLSVNLGY